jgi:hypothetical protein
MGAITITMLIFMGIGIALTFFPIMLIFVNIFNIPMGTITSFIVVLGITIVFIYAVNRGTTEKRNGKKKRVM